MKKHDGHSWKTSAIWTVSTAHVSYNLAHTEEAYCEKLPVNIQLLHSTFMQLIREHLTFSLTSSSAWSYLIMREFKIIYVAKV